MFRHHFCLVSLLCQLRVPGSILEPHQQMRIKVALGIEENLRGAGYNVNQSKIAIGSGGVLGKGFLNGTQTKLKYVPEQHTDFIFCTIGEEEGVHRLCTRALSIPLADTETYPHSRDNVRFFERVYAYCVVSILIFHLGINIRHGDRTMPGDRHTSAIFSYGGSSLLGFTMLLFILLRLDASRRDRTD